MILSVLYSGGDGRPEGQSPFLKDTAGTEQAGISEHKTKILSGLYRGRARFKGYGGSRISGHKTKIFERVVQEPSPALRDTTQMPDRHFRA